MLILRAIQSKSPFNLEMMSTSSGPFLHLLLIQHTLLPAQVRPSGKL